MVQFAFLFLVSAILYYLRRSVSASNLAKLVTRLTMVIYAIDVINGNKRIVNLGKYYFTKASVSW